MDGLLLLEFLLGSGLIPRLIPTPNIQTNLYSTLYWKASVPCLFIASAVGPKVLPINGVPLDWPERCALVFLL